MADRITGYRHIAVRLAIAAAFLGLAAGVSLAARVLLSGPRMWVQPNVRAFQSQVPQMPAGVVPVLEPVILPAQVEAKTLRNPLTATYENLARGQVYYEYYCIYCHGPYGDGNGYVGLSYIPRPTDFHDPRLQAYSDGELLRAMLLGSGHAPILERVVLPEHRWYLVLYTRWLASIKPGPTPAPIAVPTGPVEVRSPLKGE